MGKRTICDWDKKDIEKNIAIISRYVRHPEYLCRKCGRAANDKKYLCKPVPLE